MGSSVRWFVVSSPTTNNYNQVLLSQDALQEIANAKGKLELAGADASSLVGDDASALSALSQWCGKADSLVCALDTGMAMATTSEQQQQQQQQQEEEGEKPRINAAEERAKKQTWINAIKLAAQEASRNIRGKKVAIVTLDEDEDDESSTSTSGGLGGLLGSLLGGGNTPTIPATLTEALSSHGDGGVITLRHGSLLGIPESSPDFSPLVGGPLRDPVLCEEYTLRSIRLDPTFATWVSASGTTSASKSSSLMVRSSRHSVGQAAALMALGKVEASSGWDVCLSSLRGRDPISLEGWQEEFRRIVSAVSSASSSSASAPLFVASFGSVPNVERLADWLATKWAPTVLRMYDISSIRTGARPVYATRAGPGRVEIVWQELIDFDTVTTAKMILQISDTGLVATRELLIDSVEEDNDNDQKSKLPSKRSKPLKGEAILVRQLAEAVSQAMEKGLAEKVRSSNRLIPAVLLQSLIWCFHIFPTFPFQPRLSKETKLEPTLPEPVATVTSVIESGSVTTPAVPSTAVPPTSASSSLESGPRAAGARRSSQRQRGSGAKSPEEEEK
jgi:hypothetical protein